MTTTTDYNQQAIDFLASTGTTFTVTYKEVMKEWKNIELLFTPEQLEQLQEIN